MAIFMIYIILVAAYGALTSDPKICFWEDWLSTNSIYIFLKSGEYLFLYSFS